MEHYVSKIFNGMGILEVELAFMMLSFCDDCWHEKWN